MEFVNCIRDEMAGLARRIEVLERQFIDSDLTNRTGEPLSDGWKRRKLRHLVALHHRYDELAEVYKRLNRRAHLVMGWGLPFDAPDLEVVRGGERDAGIRGEKRG